MKATRGVVIVLLLVALSLAAMSTTLSRYSDDFSGEDAVLIAKWNFGASGEDDEEFYNKGFSFDLFKATSVEPMDFGEKSFTFRSGNSDVDIEYNIEMSADELIQLTTDSNKATIATAGGKDVYAPFIFKVYAEINPDATDVAPVVFDSDWFRLQDVAIGEDGYFSIFDLTGGKPFFSANSEDEVTVTVKWQWNTSYFINDTGVPATIPNITPDDTTGSGIYLAYYQLAFDEYYGEGGLQDQRDEAQNEVNSYLTEHGSPQPDGTWPHNSVCGLSDAQHNSQYDSISDEAERAAYLSEHNGTINGSEIIWSEHSIACTHNHFAEYNSLAASANAANNACATSLLAAYDDYDTYAANALYLKQAVKVIFRITGDQVMPTTE